MQRKVDFYSGDLKYLYSFTSDSYFPLSYSTSSTETALSKITRELLNCCLQRFLFSSYPFWPLCYAWQWWFAPSWNFPLPHFLEHCFLLFLFSSWLSDYVFSVSSSYSFNVSLYKIHILVSFSSHDTFFPRARSFIIFISHLYVMISKLISLAHLHSWCSYPCHSNVY